MSNYILAIDQGTTTTRVLIFDKMERILGSHQIRFHQYFPENGWVEHDPEEIWQSVLTCCKKAIEKAKLTGSDIAAIGITNQRETTLVWDIKTGKTIYPAIVWQDRRTKDICKSLVKDKLSNNLITEKTGLLLDPYFSATKITWILDHVDGARNRAEKGELAFGTIDSYLLWHLTKGKTHATDATNASRTLLFNIKTQCWDKELLALFQIPAQILPDVRDNNALFGTTEKSLFGAEIPITGIAGDQQAATIGQACLKPGMIKSTYGTGGFVLLNTGDELIRSHCRLLSTTAYRINGIVTYGLEGSIFSTGTTLQWLDQSLHLLTSVHESENMALSVTDTNGVYLIPAFTGLGAPHWDPDARAAMLGMSRATEPAHIVRAALDAVCYQTTDLIHAIQVDFSKPLQTLRIDGGMAMNNYLLQFLADMLGVPVERPQHIETTVFGAAFLAGLGAGLYSNLDEINQYWVLDKQLTPEMSLEKKEALYTGWREAVSRIITT